MAKRKIKERRKNIRLALSIKAHLQLTDEILLPGRTANISFSGAFVEFDQIPVINMGSYFKLILLKRVEFTCKAIHINRRGVGFQFDFILIKYYEHFKKMMLHNAPDPERLIKELGRHANGH